MFKLMLKFFPILALCMLTACGGGDTALRDSVIPAPTQSRVDLLFGYYGTFGNQLKETQDHVNLLWESMFEGEEKSIKNIESAKLPTVLQVSNYLYTYTGSPAQHYLRPDATERLRDWFQELDNLGLLKYVVALYPVDEPDISVSDQGESKTANRIVRAVASEFKALKGVKLAVIFAGTERLTNIEDYDWVGFDNYDQSSAMFTNGYYKKLVDKLRANQKIILVPGGAFGQNPTPFMNYANTHNQVVAVVPFVWFNGTSPSEGITGIRDNGLAEDYRKAGLSVKQNLN